MKKPDHILIVDGDRELRERVAVFLESNRMRVSHANCGRVLRSMMESDLPDLVVIDVDLPDIDGLTLCSELRASRHHYAVPMLLLSVRHDEEDRILGLEMGADDYMGKPFGVRELHARIRAILRRANMLPPGMRVTESGSVLRFGEWALDTVARHLVDADGTIVLLSSAEYRLLRVFLDYPNRVLTRDQLLNLTQGRQADFLDRSIDLLVSRIRQRLRDTVREARYIKTLRNEGYVFAAAVTVAANRVPRELQL